jgi:hypothetical protein
MRRPRRVPDEWGQTRLSPNLVVNFVVNVVVDSVNDKVNDKVFSGMAGTHPHSLGIGIGIAIGIEPQKGEWGPTTLSPILVVNLIVNVVVD